MSDEPKATLTRYLHQTREALLSKVDGLSERDARLPRTPTGTNLAGIVKHCANVEIGYFGETFGRDWPDPDDPCFVSVDDFDADPQVDWYLPADVPVAALLDFYRRVWAFADRTIEELSLDAVGSPPWWGPPEDNRVTLHHMLVRVLADLAQHTGQADILREGIDGAVGWHGDNDSLPEGVDWPAYVARLTAIAESFPA